MDNEYDKKIDKLLGAYFIVLSVSGITYFVLGNDRTDKLVRKLVDDFKFTLPAVLIGSLLWIGLFIYWAIRKIGLDNGKQSLGAQVGYVFGRMFLYMFLPSIALTIIAVIIAKMLGTI